MKNQTYKAHLALLGANLIYGANHLIAKGIMPNKIGPSAFVFLRVLGAGLLFWMIKFFVIEKVVKKDFPILIAGGLFGVTANQLLFFHGLNLTSPIDASIIITATPVLVLIFSALKLKEKITQQKLIGIFIGAVGAFLLIWYGKKSVGTSSVLGNLFVLINACSYAFYLVLIKPLMQKYSAITVVSWVFLFGFVFMFPIGIGDIITTNFSAFTVNTYLTVAFVVLGTTFLAYLFNVYALSHVAPSVSGSYIYLQPVVSFIMVSVYAYVLGQSAYAHDINFIKILSSILVIIGVYLIGRQSKKIT